MSLQITTIRGRREWASGNTVDCAQFSADQCTVQVMAGALARPSTVAFGRIPASIVGAFLSTR
jgi:hypothetical protein